MCCTTEKLCVSNNGNVYYNPHCNTLRLTFGNLIIEQSVTDMQTIYDSVQECCDHFSRERCRNKRCIVFRTTTPSIHFYFSPIEIQELQYLLESSFLKIAVHA